MIQILTQKIDIAIPDDSNFNTKETEKVSTKTWRLNSERCGK
jgi:hypothetical protein